MLHAGGAYHLSPHQLTGRTPQYFALKPQLFSFLKSSSQSEKLILSISCLLENRPLLIEEKVIEQNLPKLYRIERIDILRLIFNFLKDHTGEIIEYRNITGDLGLDLKTVRKYFDYLAKSYLIAYCHNRTKKPVKSARSGFRSRR